MSGEQHAPGAREHRQLGGTYPTARMNLPTVLARLREFDGRTDLDSDERERKKRLQQRLEQLNAAIAKATGSAA